MKVAFSLAMTIIWVNRFCCLHFSPHTFANMSAILLGDVFANKRERNKRSDTAKRHVLARQKQIDSTETHNGASKVNLSENRR